MILVLAACGLRQELPEAPLDPTLEARLAADGFRYGANAVWPTDIPAAIPRLEGEIRVVKVIPGNRYRIEYRTVSPQAVEQYLTQLAADGFELQYHVYTAPSIPDEQTAARIARGEWDAVDISKPPYHLRLEPGELGASLDIDNADFMTPGPEPQITPTPLVWPEDIPNHVRPPESCRMNSLAKLGGEYEGGYQIIFECSDPMVQEHLVEDLLAAGLREIERLVSDTGQTVYVTLADSEVVVRVSDVAGPAFVVEIRPANR